MSQSRFDLIAANSRMVLRSEGIGLSVTWEYRRLTSDYGVEPRTYDDWTEFACLPTSGQHVETFDGNREVFRQDASQRIRSPDDEVSPQLVQGDQVKDPTGVTWAVTGVGSSGPGSVAYTIVRDTGLLADGDRKGGV